MSIAVGPPLQDDVPQIIHISTQLFSTFGSLPLSCKFQEEGLIGLSWSAELSPTRPTRHAQVQGHRILPQWLEAQPESRGSCGIQSFRFLKPTCPSPLELVPAKLQPSIVAAACCWDLLAFLSGGPFPYQPCPRSLSCWD